MQPLPAVIGPQSIAAGGTEIEAGVELGPGQAGIGADGFHLCKQGIGIERPGTGRDQDMLAQHVARAGALGIAVQIMGLCGLECSHAFHHFEPVGGHQQRLGRRVVAVVGPADALDQAFDVLRRADLNDQIDITPIDPQIERPGANDGPEFPGNHSTFNPFALFPRQGPMVDADRQILGIGEPEVVEKNLGLCPGVVKDQRGFVAFDLFQNRRNRVFGPTPGPGRAFLGDQHRDIGFRPRIGEQDFAGVGVFGEHPGDGTGVFDRRRQPDPAQTGGEGLQAGEGEHQLVAALGFGQSMDFIDDHPLQPGEHPVRILVADQQGQTFRRGQQDMRRIGALAALLGIGGVAGPVLDPDGQAHFGDRCSQVALDVGGKGFERADI